MGVQASSVGGDRAARCRAHKRVLSGLEFQPVETGQSGLHPAKVKSPRIHAVVFSRFVGALAERRRKLSSTRSARSHCW